MSYFPPIPVYPLAIDSDYTLFQVYDTTETIITADNEPWAEEILIKPQPPDTLEVWGDNGFATISGELLYYDAVDKDVFGRVYKLKRCARNLGGTHTQFNKVGTWIRGLVVAEHHTQIVTGILKAEEFIGENFSVDEETLDFRIRNLAAALVPSDDFSCPDVVFDFIVTQPDPTIGVVVSYAVTIIGSVSKFEIQFGDGTTTTSPVGTHTYAPNANVDPVVVVTSQNCQIVQTPIARDESSQPTFKEPLPPFFVPIPLPPDLPPFFFPSVAIPSADLFIPPIMPPCIDLSPLSNISFSLSIPSIISFVPPLNIPSIITFINVPSFGPIPFGPVPSFTPIQFGPVPSFSPIPFGPFPSIPSIAFGPFPSIPSIAFGPFPSIPDIQFGPFPSIPSIIFGPVPSIIVSFLVVEFGPVPSFTPIQFGPVPSFPPIEFGPVPSFAPIEFGPVPSFAPIQFGPVPSVIVSFLVVEFGPVPSFPPIEFGPVPSFAPIQFGPTPSFAPIEFGPVPSVIVSFLVVEFGPVPSFAPIQFGPVPSFPQIQFGPAPSFAPIQFGPVPSVIVSFLVVEFGPVPSFPPIEFGPVPSFAPIQFGPTPSFAPIQFGPVPSVIVSFLVVNFGPVPSFAPIQFGPTPSFAPIQFGPVPSVIVSFLVVNFGPVPSFAPIQFGPTPSFAPIQFGPLPSLVVNFAAVSFAPIQFGPTPSFAPIQFGPPPSFAPILFGPAPVIPTAISFVGPIPIIPATITFGPAPSFAPIQFGPVPSIIVSFLVVNFGPTPSFAPIQFGPAPTVSVNWGNPPVISCVIICPSVTPMAMGMGGPMNFDSPDSSFADDMEVQYDVVGFPSEIRIIPPYIPPITIIHDVPESITLKVPKFDDIRLVADKSVPTEMRLTLPEDKEFARIISFEFPKLRLDISDTSLAVSLAVPKDFPMLSIDASTLPEMRVVGMPSVIEVRTTIDLKIPEEAKIPVVFEGPPLSAEVKIVFDVQRLTGEDEDGIQCVKIIPCAPR